MSFDMQIKMMWTGTKIITYLRIKLVFQRFIAKRCEILVQGKYQLVLKYKQTILIFFEFPHKTNKLDSFDNHLCNYSYFRRTQNAASFPIYLPPEKCVSFSKHLICSCQIQKIQERTSTFYLFRFFSLTFCVFDKMSHGHCINLSTLLSNNEQIGQACIRNISKEIEYYKVGVNY